MIKKQKCTYLRTSIEKEILNIGTIHMQSSDHGFAHTTKEKAKRIFEKTMLG